MTETASFDFVQNLRLEAPQVGGKQTRRFGYKYHVENRIYTPHAGSMVYNEFNEKITETRDKLDEPEWGYRSYFQPCNHYIIFVNRSPVSYSAHNMRRLVSIFLRGVQFVKCIQLFWYVCMVIFQHSIRRKYAMFRIKLWLQ